MLYLETVEPHTLGLLKALTAKPYLDHFNLVGGTALALQIGHRQSVDLDFFTNQEFDNNDLLDQLQRDFSTAEPTLQKGNTLLCMVDKVKVDFIRFRYSFQHPLLQLDGLRLRAIADIAPMKLDAISGRGRKKDFFDLYFLMNYFTLPQMLEAYSSMFQHSTLFHVIRSLSFFEDAESDADPVVFDKKVTWSLVKSTISKAVQQL